MLFFTVKLYRDGGALRRLSIAAYITFGDLGGSIGDAREITLHRSDGTETYYVGPPEAVSPELREFVFERAIVENAAGRTTEIFNAARSRDLRRAV